MVEVYCNKQPWSPVNKAERWAIPTPTNVCICDDLNAAGCIAVLLLPEYHRRIYSVLEVRLGKASKATEQHLPPGKAFCEVDNMRISVPFCRCKIKSPEIKTYPLCVSPMASINRSGIIGSSQESNAVQI